MKLITTFLVAVGMLASQAVYAQDAALPQNVKTDLEAALKATDATNAKAVNKVVQAAIDKNPSLAPQVVALSVGTTGQALANNPSAAQDVIPAFVIDAAKSSPTMLAAILSSSIGAVPASLKQAVVPKIVEGILALAGDEKSKAELLNVALAAIGDNPTLVAELDRIARGSKLSITEAGDNSVRYFVDNSSGDSLFSGVQGPTNAGAGGLGGFGGSGGGSGTSSSSSSSDDPVPAS